MTHNENGIKQGEVKAMEEYQGETKKMETKEMTWISPTKLSITIFDGPAKGEYVSTIGRDIPIGGMITIGKVNINGKLTLIKLKLDDIPNYDKHYRESPTGLRSKRESLGYAISGALDDTQYARERAFDRDTGSIPSYDSPKYRAAVKALADFDIAHPEIAAKIKADNADMISRID